MNLFKIADSTRYDANGRKLRTQAAVKLWRGEMRESETLRPRRAHSN